MNKVLTWWLKKEHDTMDPTGIKNTIGHYWELYAKKFEI